MNFRSLQPILPYLFCFVLAGIMLSSCDEDDVFVTTPPPAPPDTLVIGFTGQIGNVGNAFLDGQFGFRDDDSSRFEILPLPDSSTAGYHTALFNPATGVRFSLNIGEFKFLGVQPTSSEFFALFNDSVIPYANRTMIIDTIDTIGPILDTTIIETAGIEIEYVENDSLRWSSRFGPQSAGSFQLMVLDTIVTTRENYVVDFRADFECTLYGFINDTLTTLTTSIDNGMYTGKFRQLNND